MSIGFSACIKNDPVETKDKKRAPSFCRQRVVFCCRPRYIAPGRLLDCKKNSQL